MNPQPIFATHFLVNIICVLSLGKFARLSLAPPNRIPDSPFNAVLPKHIFLRLLSYALLALAMPSPSVWAVKSHPEAPVHLPEDPRLSITEIEATAHGFKDDLQRAANRMVRRHDSSGALAALEG